MKNKNDFMLLAIKEAQKAYHKKDVPVGAVIVKNNKIISKAYNKKEKNSNAIYHAEILAISKACKKLKTWHLEDCVLYVTLEPCMMCTGAILQSRIKEVVYATKNPNSGYFESNYNISNNSNIIFNQSSDKYSEISMTLLKTFFKDQRK